MVGSVERICANTKVIQQMPYLPATLHNDGQRVLSPLDKMHSTTQCSCTNKRCHSLRVVTKLTFVYQLEHRIASKH